MKAPRLRAGLVMLAIVAIGLGAFSGPKSAYSAEEDLNAALDDYAAGRYEEALTKLREYVASNPGDDEVYAVLRDADEQVLLRVLSKQGEHERLLKYLLDKARPGAREGRIDPDEIQELVDTAVTNDSLDMRRRAGVRLKVAGDLAVPYLYRFLARSDAAVVVNSMFALHRLGATATMPLVEVLQSDNARLRGNAATVLGDIRDPHAVPALLRLKETDEDENVRAKAVAALEKIGGARATRISAAGANVRLGERYYANDPTVVATYDDVMNMWRWEDGDLARYEVPSYLFPFQMAEEYALDALELQPDLMGARVLLTRTLLAQKVEADAIQTNGGDVPEALGGAFDLATSQGFDAASEALRQCLKDRDWDVAIEAMNVLVKVYGGESLARHPLGAALIAPERRVRYVAAISALLMSPPQKGLPNADKVANLAARAASERALRQVLVIDDREDTRARLVMDLAHAGYVSASVASGADGVARAKFAPTLDVIIIRADLGNPMTTIPARRNTSSIMVIDELKNDVRTKDMRIVVLIQDTMESKMAVAREFFESKYGDDLAGFIEAPIDTASAMEIVNGAAEAGDLNPDRARANALAARAARAFAQTDFSCASFDLKVAIEPLSMAAAEGPTPEVQLAAVEALGNIRTGGADALVTVLTGDGDEELRAAAATALGSVLSAMDGETAQVEALIEASKAENGVGAAALAALGQVRNLTAEQRRDVFKTHRLQIGERQGP